MLEKTASNLRMNIIRTAWEETDKNPGFINVIHELCLNGSVPEYKSGETGYTLGSLTGSDYDGIRRRELATQAFCLEMLRTDRAYLEEIPQKENMITGLLSGIDTIFSKPKLGLVMFSRPMANNRNTIDKVGRMGVLPAGTAENGEYHHCQVFMHLFRLKHPGEVNRVWEQFKPILSAMRDSSLGGPFETPATSYVSDSDDPHFGMGMYFGLSGSIDWIIEIFQRIVGVHLNLHDDSLPDLSIEPMLPDELNDSLSFKRIIHYSMGKGKYKKIPLTITIVKSSIVYKPEAISVSINGILRDKAEIKDVSNMRKIEIEIIKGAKA